MQAVNIFLSCSTQWRFRSGPNSSIPCGLDYSSVISVMRLHKVKREVFEQVQVMEFAAVKILASP